MSKLTHGGNAITPRMISLPISYIKVGDKTTIHYWDHIEVHFDGISESQRDFLKGISGDTCAELGGMTWTLPGAKVTHMWTNKAIIEFNSPALTGCTA